MKCSSKYSGSDEEHLLIARYACRLASPVVVAAAGFAAAAGQETPPAADVSAQEATVQQLLQKNRQIAAEIEQLKRLRQEASGERAPDAAALYSSSGGGGLDERLTLCADLLVLKQHKSELEEKMGKLRQSRKDLVEQLESLMRLLRERGEAEKALSASLSRSRSRSPEPPKFLACCGEPGASPARTSPRSPCPGSVGAKHTATVAGVGGAGRPIASVSGELLGAVAEISAAVADLVKEITQSPPSALSDGIPDRS